MIILDPWFMHTKLKVFNYDNQKYGILLCIAHWLMYEKYLELLTLDAQDKYTCGHLSYTNTTRRINKIDTEGIHAFLVFDALSKELTS